MPSVANHTPFACALQPHVDDDGLHCQLLVAKGVWSLRTQQLADRPGELVLRTTPHLVCIGDLQLSAAQRRVTEDRKDERIEWYPSDVHPAKPLFDLIVCGYAHSAPACARIHAAIQWGQQRAELVAWAPRLWQPTRLAGGGAVAGPVLELVERIPVHPAFAYGGVSGAQAAIAHPQGMGQFDPRNAMAAQAMPWLEHPGHAIRHLSSGGALSNPVAFGPWPASARQRAQHLGTYDDAWQRQRSPLPPLDLDPRHFNQADRRLQWPGPPAPGAMIHLHHLGRIGSQSLRWPHVGLRMQVAGHVAQTLAPDTCIIDTEAEQFAIVWRHQVPAGASPTLSV